ncbi:MAG: DUF1405 domain-containing protein [Haloarculaceae archaeon]
MEGFGRRLNDAAARYAGGQVPPREPLPRTVAPLPPWLEAFGLRLAWLVVALNLAGTAFGFWFYRFQFAITPTVAFPVVPDSPMATLFIAATLAAWKLGYRRATEWLAPLAFFGCLKLGAWTPFVLLAFPAEYPSGSLAALGPLSFGYEYGLFAFLVTSHLAMVAEGFLLHRIAGFRVRPVALATAWYAFNDVVDYLVPVVGEPHHTLLNVEFVDGGIDHTIAAHDLAAAAAVTLTVACVFLALYTRIGKLAAGGTDRPDGGRGR